MMPTNKKTGFTLTELAIAIAFFSILLLTIAAVTINLARNYHKGSTLKSINTVGLGLIDEFSSAVSESPVFDAESLCKTFGNIGIKTKVYDEHGIPKTDDAGNQIYEYTGGDEGARNCMNDQARKFIHQQFDDNINLTKNGAVKKGPAIGVDNYLPTSGVFCTGKYSYVWNTGYIISQDSNYHSMTSNFYSGGDGIGDPPHFRLQKYQDTGRTFCIRNFPENPTDPSKQTYPNALTRHDNHLTATMNSFSSALVSLELINASDIAIYSMTINPPTVNEQSGRSLYTGSFVLGSITGDIEINDNSSGCSLESVSSFDVEYCATNKFNFAMRAMGGNSGN